MAINKIVYSGRVLIDLTQDDISPSKMLDGTTAHDAKGMPIIGSIPISSGGVITPGVDEVVAVEGGTYVSKTIKVAGVPSAIGVSF